MEAPAWCSVTGWHRHRHHAGPSPSVTTRREGWGHLSGHQWGPRLGHQWGLFHGHGQLDGTPEACTAGGLIRVRKVFRETGVPSRVANSRFGRTQAPRVDPGSELATSSGGGSMGRGSFVRPATTLIVRYIDEHVGVRDGDGRRWGVEAICDQLTELGAKIAPATYYEHRSKKPSAREERDEELKPKIAAFHARRLVEGTCAAGPREQNCTLRWPATTSGPSRDSC